MKGKLCLLICAVLALCALTAGYAAELDIENMSLEELLSLRDVVNARISALEQADDARVYESGSYLVGQDIPAGDYLLKENDDAVFAGVSTREGNAEGSALISHHLINRQAVVRLNADTWVTLTGARAYPISQAAMATGAVGEGGYLVGATLPAGGYIVNKAEKVPLSSYSVYDGVLDSG